MAADTASLPYGLSWWLDAVTDKNWDGVVVDDYRLVLPLPKGKSLGRVAQVQRASFTQQGGPFGQLRSGDVHDILHALPPRYLSFQLPLQEGIVPTDVPSGFSTRTRTNYILDLSPTYEEINLGFNKVLRRKLRRNGPATLSPAEPDLIIELYQNSVGTKAGLQPKHYRWIRQLMVAAQANESAVLCRLDDPENGCLAAGFFPWYQGRLINLFAASSPAGYQHEGMARMLVALIKQHRGAGCLLDFEGSDIPGVAEYFRSFGPERRQYLTVERKGVRKWIGKV